MGFIEGKNPKLYKCKCCGHKLPVGDFVDADPNKLCLHCDSLEPPTCGTHGDY
jgi:hypothetical protein